MVIISMPGIKPFRNIRKRGKSRLRLRISNGMAFYRWKKLKRAQRAFDRLLLTHPVPNIFKNGTKDLAFLDKQSTF